MGRYRGWGRHLSNPWPLLGSFLRRRSLEVLSRRASSGDEEAVRILGESLPHLGDPAWRGRALEALAAAGEREVPLAREILCSLVLEEDDDRARELCLARGFAPEDEARRAVFFVLTGQWEEYESLDFHQRLLKKGYWSAGEGVRQRVLACLRSAGRSEWLRRLLLEGPGAPGEPRIREMGEEEWSAMTASLAAQGRWPELARLAEVASLRRGAAILRTLGRAADRSFLREEELEELVRLAEDWEGEAKAAGELVMGRLAWRRKQEGWVEHLSFSPDGRYLALASWDSTVRLLDLAEKRISWIGRHGDAVWGVAFSPDGKLVVSGSSDGTVRLWQVADGSCLWVKRHQGPVWAVALSPDGRHLASGGKEGVVRLFRLQDRECLWRRRHDDAVFALSFSPDGQYLASGGKDRTVRLFRASDGDLLWTADHGGAVWTILFSPDGKHLVSRGRDAAVCLFRVSDGQRAWVGEHGDAVWGVAFSPDGKLLASGSSDRRVRLFRVSTGQCVWSAEHRDAVWGVAFSPDGRLLVSSSSDRELRLFRVSDGQCLWVGRHDDAVWSTAFSPDGSRLVSFSSDYLLRLWDLVPWWDLPLADIGEEELEWLKQKMDLRCRRSLRLLGELVRRRRRWEIELEDSPRRVAAGEFDIEIEGA